MRTPSLKTPAAKLLRFYSWYHLTSVRTSVIAAKVAEIIANFSNAHDTFSVTIDTRTQAEDALVEASAVRDRSHRQMGRGVRNFAYAVLARVHEDRTSPVYRAYFPDGYGVFNKMGIRDRIEAAERMLNHLAMVPDEELAPAGAALSSVLEEVKVKEAAYQAAKEAARAATEAVEVAKRPRRDAYRASYHALSIFHSDDPREAESYFRQFKYGKRTFDPAEGEGEDLGDDVGVDEGVDEGNALVAPPVAAGRETATTMSPAAGGFGGDSVVAGDGNGRMSGNGAGSPVEEEFAEDGSRGA